MPMQDPEDDEALRMEIQAAIAAGREVGPEMDSHLADSVLERYRQEQAARQAVRQPTPARQPNLLLPTHQPQSTEIIGRTVLAIAGMAVLVSLLFWQPHAWWILFFLPGLFGFWGRRRWYGNRYGYRRRDDDSDRWIARRDDAHALPQDHVDIV
jgi:hypothetical protein